MSLGVQHRTGRGATQMAGLFTEGAAGDRNAVQILGRIQGMLSWMPAERIAGIL